jgi:hypothetical protein
MGARPDPFGRPIKRVLQEFELLVGLDVRKALEFARGSAESV